MLRPCPITAASASVLAALCLATTAARSATAQATASRAPAITYRTMPIDIEARPRDPLPVRGDDGRRFVVYTLLVTNWGDRDLRLASVEVRGGDDARLLLVRYDSAALEDPLRQRSILAGALRRGPDNRLLPPGRTALLTVGVAFDSAAAPPSALRHRVVFEPDTGVALVSDDGTLTRELAALSEPLPLGRSEPVVLGPPLRGGPWRCGNGLSYTSAHEALYTFRTARLRTPQRYGCDFYKVDSAGSILPNPFPDTISNAMFYGYGAEVLAVADARVAYAKDGVPENVPRADGGIAMPVPLTNETVSGNWVSLDLGNGRYAFYAHLQPGSIRVTTGQRVRRGDVIGLLGNAGNSVGPHLHFHVGDRNALNESVAVPYVFDAFRFYGRGRPAQGSVRAGGTAKRRALPLGDAVIGFPAGTARAR